MKWAESESRASETKHKCTALVMVPEVVDSLVDFDELEEDYDYPESDLECFMR